MAASAFTLPEVLAALVLIAIVLPAVLKGVSLSLAASDDAKRKMQAAALAETKLADLTATALEQGSAGGGSGDFSPEYPAYRWEATSADAEEDITELSVRVVWTGRGAERSVTLSTFVYIGAAAGDTASSGAPGGGS